MTAKGKQTAARLRRGDRILITDDRSKASTITAGGWHPARVKKEVTTALVTGVETDPDSRRRRYDVTTDVGAVVSVTGVQTFLLGAEPPPPRQASPIAEWVLLQQEVATPERRACLDSAVANADDTVAESARGMTDAVTSQFEHGDQTWCRLVLSAYRFMLESGAHAHLNGERTDAPLPRVRFHPDAPAVDATLAAGFRFRGRDYDMVARLDVVPGDVILLYGAELWVREVHLVACADGHPGRHRWHATVLGVANQDRRGTYLQPWSTAVCLAYDTGIPRRRETGHRHDRAPASDPLRSREGKHEKGANDPVYGTGR